MYVFELIGEDDAFAAYEAAAWAEDVRVAAPGVALAAAITDRIDQLAWTRNVLGLVARTEPTSDAMVAGLRSSDVGSGGTVAVRARGVRDAAADTQAIERQVGEALAEAGHRIDLEAPDRLLRVLVTGEEAFLGWVLARPGGDVGRRRPTDRPFFQPGSMSPRLARAIVNFVRIEAGTVVLDPMCGTGGILLEAVRVGARAIGCDAQERMVRGTRRNWRAVDSETGPLEVAIADARSLPLADGAVDVVIADVPYGRQSPVAGEDLVRSALWEAHRVARAGVVVADRDLQDVLEETPWTIEQRFEKRVHRSLTRYIIHLRGRGSES